MNLCDLSLKIVQHVATHNIFIKPLIICSVGLITIVIRGLAKREIPKYRTQIPEMIYHWGSKSDNHCSVKIFQNTAVHYKPEGEYSAVSAM